MISQTEQNLNISKRTYVILTSVTAVGVVVFLSGLFFAPQRIWSNFLIMEFFLLSLGVGAGFFQAALYLSNAGWSASIKRIPEAMMSTLPAGLIGALILIFGIHSLYEWSHLSVVAEDPILQEKSVWLNQPFFIGRLIFYFIVWIALSRAMIKHSLQQDSDGLLLHTRRNTRYAAIFMAAVAITFSLASFDLLMSLQPHWYSTVFALLIISGMISSALAVMAVVMVVLRRMGYGHIFTDNHLRTIANLLLSFCVFWVYMWVSQHMLIWYSNIPEETSYYIFRHFGGWGSLSFINVVLNWLIPFLILLPKGNKVNDKIMLQVSIVLLIGHWLDLYIIVMPPTMGAQPTFGIWEIGLFGGAMALFFLLVFRWLKLRALVPKNDPYLIESMNILSD